MESEALQTYLRKHYPNALVSNFERIASGFEADIYAFRLPALKAYEDFVLRAYLGDGALAKIERELAGMRLLRQVAYPVPEILLHEPDAAVLGKPFVIMEKLHGQSLWPVLNSANPVEEAAYLQQFAELLARLHRLNWKDAGNSDAILPDLLAELRHEFTKFNLKGFFPLADWLNKNAVEIRPSLVHLDFHANNVFLHPDKQMSVIDWSQFALSDYRLDLSWTLLIMGDYGKAGWREKIFDDYKTASGYEAENLDYFNVLSYNKFLSSNVIAYQQGAAKTGLDPNSYMMSKEHLASIRSVYERMQAVTGLTIAEIEAILNEFE